MSPTSSACTAERVSARRSTCRPVGGADELAQHFSVRRQVFVEQQRLFAGSDRDVHDEAPATVHVVGLAGGAIVGAVRLYPLDDEGLWKGDRLAVLPGARALQLGADLVRCAVALAGEAGGRTMYASVQAPNVRFFERLGWRAVGERTWFHGVEHQGMEIALTPRSGG